MSLAAAAVSDLAASTAAVECEIAQRIVAESEETVAGAGASAALLSATACSATLEVL